MNELRAFESEQFGQVRTVEQDGQTWFVAADVCRALDIANPTDAIKRLDEDERARFNLGRQGETNTINEPGLYTLVLSSRKQEAKAFKRWITHEVLPSIRKHGAYATDRTIDQIISDPDFGIKLLGQLKQERETRRMLEDLSRADAPKVRFAEAVESAKDDILIGEMAQILAQNGVKTGERRLFETLRKDGYLKKCKGADWNMPTQRSIELGVMRIVKRTVILPSGREEIRRTTKITGKGQIYFLDRYIRTADVC